MRAHGSACAPSILSPRPPLARGRRTNGGRPRVRPRARAAPRAGRQARESKGRERARRGCYGRRGVSARGSAGAGTTASTTQPSQAAPAAHRIRAGASRADPMPRREIARETVVLQRPRVTHATRRTSAFGSHQIGNAGPLHRHLGVGPGGVGGADAAPGRACVGRRRRCLVPRAVQRSRLVHEGALPLLRRMDRPHVHDARVLGMRARAVRRGSVRVQSWLDWHSLPRARVPRWLLRPRRLRQRHVRVRG